MSCIIIDYLQQSLGYLYQDPRTLLVKALDINLNEDVE